MVPFSQLAARLFELSHAQLPEIAAAGGEASPEVMDQAEAILAANPPLAQPLVTTASTMALRARSPDADMDGLGKPMIARLLAAEFYRLKSELRLLCDENRILINLYKAESRMYEAGRPERAYCLTARGSGIDAERRESLDKLREVERQLVRFENEALPQATFSVWGTEMTLLERSHIDRETRGLKRRLDVIS